MATSRRPVEARDGLRRVDRAPASDADEPVGSFGRSRRGHDDVDGSVTPHSGEAGCDRKVELAEACGGDEERTLDAELVEQRRQLVEAPADDHDARRSRANATNASATLVRARPVADASEISRVASSPSTRASARRPASRSDSTAVREMKVTP